MNHQGATGHLQSASLYGTHPSLLSRVRNPSDVAAWREFECRYREFLVRFCRRSGLQLADAEDIVQIVMANLARSLPGFTYDKSRGRFRDYLYRCTRNAISQRAARPTMHAGALDTHIEAESAMPVDPEAEAAWEAEWIAHHYRLAMKTIRETFEPRSIEVFDRSIAGEDVATLATEFGMSQQAVHKIRQRIKARMEELIAAQVREEDAADG